MSGVPQGSHERGVPQSMGALVREQGAASVHLQVGMLVLQRAELEQLSLCFLSYVSFVCALKLLALTSMTFGASSNGQSENNKIDQSNLQELNVQIISLSFTYSGPLAEWVEESLGWQMEVAPKRTKKMVEDDFWQCVKERQKTGATGAALFAGLVWNRRAGGVMKVIPKRWVVERTFAWLGRSRRLSKDYEMLPCSSGAFVCLAMIRLMLKRLGKQQIFSAVNHL
jgi:transposase